MSSGAKVVSHIVRESIPGITPVSPTWQVMRLTSNAMTPTVNTEESEEITDTRLGQGSVATSIDIGGDLAGEFSYSTFDSLLSAAFYSEWVSNELSIGETRITHSIAKAFKDVNVYTIFKGAHVSTFALDIPEEGKVTVTFNMMCLDYDDQGTAIVTSADPATTTPFMSALSVGDVTVDGESMEGIACVSAMTMNIDNSLQTQRCLGTDKLGPGALIETAANVTGTIVLAWSSKAWELWRNQFTRKTIAVSFPITDSLGNSYLFDFPAIEVDGDLPSGGRTDLIQVTLNWMASKTSPTVTRTPGPTSLAVLPATDIIAIAETVQLTVTSLPSGSLPTVTWSSADAAIATVSSTGLVTGVAAGEVVITATSTLNSAITDTSTITVTV